MSMSRSCSPATPIPTTSPATPCANELTGAKVFVMHGDDEVIASGGEGQYLYSRIAGSHARSTACWKTARR